MKTKMKRWILLLEAMVASLVTMVPMGSAQTEVSGLTEIELWHVLLAISFFFAILTFSYPLVMRIRRKRREEREKEEGMRREEEKRLEVKEKEEEIIRILKEVKALKERIEKREEGLTSLTDFILATISFEIGNMSNRMEGMSNRIEKLDSRAKGIDKGINDMKSLMLFGLSALFALGLVIISMS